MYKRRRRLDSVLGYSLRRTRDDAFEALAEIYAAHKQGRQIPQNLKTFFNDFSPNYQIP